MCCHSFTKSILSRPLTPTKLQPEPLAQYADVGIVARVPPQRATARPVAYVLAVDSHIGDGPLIGSGSSRSGVVAAPPSQGGMLSRRTGGRKCGLLWDCLGRGKGGARCGTRNITSCVSLNSRDIRLGSLCLAIARDMPLKHPPSPSDSTSPSASSKSRLLQDVRRRAKAVQRIIKF